MDWRSVVVVCGSVLWDVGDGVGWLVVVEGDVWEELEDLGERWSWGD